MAPEGDVVTQELEDQGRLRVNLVRQPVEVRTCFVERFLGDLDSLPLLPKDFVEKHGIVQYQSE